MSFLTTRPSEQHEEERHRTKKEREDQNKKRGKCPGRAGAEVEQFDHTCRVARYLPRWPGHDSQLDLLNNVAYCVVPSF